MIRHPTRFTHYSYISGPDGIRLPTGMYDWHDVSIDSRRGRIHSFMQNGELLALIPYASEVQTMVDLRNILMWVEAQKKKDR